MKIVYLFDIVCPWCFIGKKYFDNISNEIRSKIVEITWQPYFLNPDFGIEGVDRKEYLEKKFGGKENANIIYDNLVSTGKKVNIKFNFDSIKIMPNSLNIMYLITLIKDYKSASKFIDQLFKAFFEKGENIGDNKVLEKYAIKNFENFDLKVLDNEKNKSFLLQADKQFKIKGVKGVPGIIVNKKHFISGAVEPAKLKTLFNKINLGSFN